MWIVPAWKSSAHSSSSIALQMGGRQRRLAVSSTDKVIAPSFLMLMQRAKQHGNEHYPATLRCLPLDADSMRSVRPAIGDANAARWYAHAPPLFKCTRANGSAPMQVGAMATIGANSLQPCKPSRR